MFSPVVGVGEVIAASMVMHLLPVHLLRRAIDAPSAKNAGIHFALFSARTLRHLDVPGPSVNKEPHERETRTPQPTR